MISNDTFLFGSTDNFRIVRFFYDEVIAFTLLFALLTSQLKKKLTFTTLWEKFPQIDISHVASIPSEEGSRVVVSFNPSLPLSIFDVASNKEYLHSDPKLQGNAITDLFLFQFSALAVIDDNLVKIDLDANLQEVSSDFFSSPSPSPINYTLEGFAPPLDSYTDSNDVEGGSHKGEREKEEKGEAL